MAAHEKFRLADEEALAAKAAELGVRIPIAPDFGPLLEKAPIAGRVLPHRLAVHPMEGADAEPDGSPGPLTGRRYERFAAGGAGLIWFEATAVCLEGRSHPRQLVIGPKTLDGFKRLVGRTRAASPGKSLLLLQLHHAGRMAAPDGRPSPLIVRRDPALDALKKISPAHPLLSDEKLDGLLERYVRAAALARDAGFDGVDVKACHGYLVGELLAARSRPASRYGGSFENRTRFLRNALRAIRLECPGLLTACRLGVYDGVADGFGVRQDDSALDDPREPLALVRLLAEDGLSLLNVTAGIPACVPHIGRPFDRPVPGGRVPGEHPLEGIARLIRLAGEIQRAFPGLPVVGTGYSWLRHLFPAVAAAVLAEKSASLIGLGRMSFARPSFPLDLARKNRLARKTTCTACSGCSALLRAALPAGCVVRDRAVYPPAPGFDA